MSTDNFTYNQPQEGAYLVYINGIEVPSSGVSVRHGVGEYPSATVSVAPDNNLIQLGAQDRLEVQVFFKDNHYPTSLGAPPDFRIMFDGIITGWSYSISAGQRTIQFDCVSNVQVLDELQPDFVSGPESIAMQAIGTKTGTEVSSSQTTLTFPWDLFFSGIFPETKADGTKTSKAPLVRRPFDIIQNVFRAIMGREMLSLGSVPAALFYSRYLQKIGLHKRFLPSPILETDVMQTRDVNNVFPLLKGLQDAALYASYKNQAVEAGLSSTIWGTIQGLFQGVYYEILSIPTAPIVQVEMGADTTNHGSVLGPPAWTDDAPVTRAPVFNEPPKPTRPSVLVNHVTKPQWLFGIPPTCNVVFPSMITDLQYSENFLQQPTRIYVNDKSVPSSLNINPDMQKSLSTLVFGYPAQAQYETRRRFNNPSVSGKNFLIWPEEFYKGPVARSMDAPPWLWTMKESIDADQTIEEQVAQAALDKIEQYEADYWQIAYNQALQESDPTTAYDAYQSLINVPEEPLGPVAQQDANTVRALEIKNTLLAKLKNDEKFKTLLRVLKTQGIVSNDVVSVNELREALQLRATGKGARMRYLQNILARYEYYRQRSAVRQGTATLSFNPYIVAGFPAVFFDSMSDVQHFVGYVTSVVQDMTTRGMQTSVSFVHAQPLDEFLNEVYSARVGNNIDGVLEDINAGPPQPVPELRTVMQNQEKAEEYFSLLFHQGASYGSNKKKSAAFDVPGSIQFVIPGTTGVAYKTFQDVFDAHTLQVQKKRKDEYDKLEAEYLKEAENITAQAQSIQQDPNIYPGADGQSLDPDFIAKKVAGELTALRERYDNKRLAIEMRVPSGPLPNAVLDNYTGIAPAPGLEKMFTYHDAAMQLVSRPICTLDEYISFRSPWGCRVKMVPPHDALQGKGATFWEKILNFTAGPGEAPTFDKDNFLASPTAAELPDTRMNWQSRLVNYRKKILFGKLPEKNKES